MLLLLQVQTKLSQIEELSRTGASMHLCNGCDRIVQDERVWELRKRNETGGTLRCRVCNLQVPAERSLPHDGPKGESGLLRLGTSEPSEAVAHYTDSLVERVRAGSWSASGDP